MGIQCRFIIPLLAIMCLSVNVKSAENTFAEFQCEVEVQRYKEMSTEQKIEYDTRPIEIFCLQALNKLDISIEKNLDHSFQRASTDTSPPEIVDIVLSVHQIDVTDEVQVVDVTVKVREDTGIEGQTLWFRLPELGLFVHPVRRNGWVFDEEEQVYIDTLTFEFSPERAAGTYEFSTLFSFSDVLGNSSSDYDSGAKLVALGFNPYLEVSNSNATDTTAPEIVDITLNVHQIEVTNEVQVVDVTVKVREDTGIEGQTLWFRLPELGLFVRPVRRNGWVFDEEEQVYIDTFTFEFSPERAAGTYEFSTFVSFSDVLGNSTSDYNSGAKLAALGFNPYLEVSNSNATDTTAPEIVDITLSVHQIDVSNEVQVVDVTVKVREDAGIEGQTLWFRLPELGLFVYPMHRKGWIFDEEEQVYIDTLTFEFSPERAAGTYEFSTFLSFSDVLGNSTGDYDSGVKLAALGFNPYLSIQSGETLSEFDASITVIGQSKEEDSISYSLSFILSPETEYEVITTLSLGSFVSFPIFHSKSTFSSFCSSNNAFSRCLISSQGELTMQFETNIEISDEYKLVVQMPPAPGILDADMSNNIAFLNADTITQRRAIPYDYDGDGKADVAVRRSENFFQYILNSLDSSITRTQFGRDVKDIPISGDFDGDGKADLAVRRPGNKFWYIKNSSNGEIQRLNFGLQETDIPVPADYDNDGITDIAVRRPSNFTWYILNSSDGEIRRVVFGKQDGDIPVAADYDGDGIIDIAVRRPSNQTWYILNSSDSEIQRIVFGRQADDIPVPADYDGDGITDVAVRRPSNQTWYILNSSDGEIQRVLFGRQEADIPIPADYDGDGKADIAVRRPSTQYQYILNSSDGQIQRIKFGRSPNDIPMAAPINTRMNWVNRDYSLFKVGQESPVIDKISPEEFKVSVDNGKVVNF